VSDRLPAMPATIEEIEAPRVSDNRIFVRLLSDTSDSVSDRWLFSPVDIGVCRVPHVSDTVVFRS